VFDEQSRSRLKLAGRVLLQLSCGGGQPLLLSEIAELQFLAESGEERNLPLDQLERAIIKRETRRSGVRPYENAFPDS